jgi:hypothetical protein
VDLFIGFERPELTMTFIEKMISVTLKHPCLVTVIQSEVIDAMSVSIYDEIPKTQSFLPFKDSESISYTNPDLCGPKQYVISNPMTSIAKPASNLINTDPWTISAVYDKIS